MPDRIIIQIYEVQRPSEAEKLIETGVDHIGSVILSKEEWKQAGVKETIDCVAKTQAKSSLIPLFSHPDSVFKVIDYYRPDIVHFCEKLAYQTETSDVCEKYVRLQKAVRKRFPEISIMRSIPITREGEAVQINSLDLARKFEPWSDYFLTDTLLTRESSLSLDQQALEGFVGITGLTCNWDTAEKLVKSSRIPVILAGGISPDNVAAGIMRTRPAGVDSCTLTNAIDDGGKAVRFKKNLDKVRALVKLVRESEKTDFERA